MLSSSVTEFNRCGSPRANLVHPKDREMRCANCGGRAFTSRAPELVRAMATCVRCGDRMLLVPADDEAATG